MGVIASFEEPSALSRVLAASSFAVSVLFIGIPVWLKTTEVYRAAIPYIDIDRLQLLSLHDYFGVTVRLVTDTNEGGHLWRSRLNSCGGNVRVEGRLWTPDELKLLRSGNVWQVEDLIESLSSSDHEEDRSFLKVHVVPDDSDDGSYGNGKIRLGNRNNCFIGRSASTETLCALIKGFLGEDAADKTAVTRVRTSSEYRVVVSVVVPDVESADVPAETTTAVCERLQLLTSQLHMLANITIISQYIYNVNFDFATRRNSSTNAHYIEEGMMPLLFTPLESGLGSYVALDTTLNFVLYVVPASKRPLHVSSASGQVAAFISPRWGGVQLVNNLPLNPAATAAVISSQLRRLLGMDQVMPCSAAETEVIHRSTTQLGQYQLQHLRAVRTIDNLSNSRQNLISLAAMLARISNIVISDDVGSAVTNSLASIHQSLSLISAGKHQQAYLESLTAVKSSETAIYDPSMLALLYFPDDQKYAIYIPLFLPISIPVIASLSTIFKYFRAIRNKSKID